MKSSFAFAALAGVSAQQFRGSPWDPIYTTRAQQKLASLNLTEKLAFVRGYSGSYVGNVPSIGGLPPLNLEGT
jgi:hypothetical protein